MKKLIIAYLLCLVCLGVKAQHLVSGADLSWCTEMESTGRKFYNIKGEEKDVFALMKELGMTAIRLRVFEHPENSYGPWCDKADVVAKARRANAQGLDLMIDFHYSDRFADPEHQNVPKTWEGMSSEQVKEALANHTKDVLQALKDEGITPKWVQVGNETNSGIAMMHGQIHWDKTGADRFTDYVAISNVGYDAVKSVFPDANVIVHLGGTENARWFFPDFIAAGGKVDMIGLSHYPTLEQWNSADSEATHSNINAEKYVKEAIEKFNLPVMLCETGFDVTKPQLAHEVMIDLFNRMNKISRCAGIFYWEPEVDGQWKPASYEALGWGAYGMGAFTSDGKPTKILDAFSGRTTVDDHISCLKIYDNDGKVILSTLLPIEGKSGIYTAKLNVTEGWMNFKIFDFENCIWYGTVPNESTKLTTSDDKWGFWINSDQIGMYDITVDLNTMTWSHAPSSNDPVVNPDDLPTELKLYDNDGQNIIGTLSPKNGEEGVYFGELEATSAWFNFKIVDLGNGVWYGTVPNESTKLSTADDKWGFWINSEQTGKYRITVNPKNMTWSHEYMDNSGIEEITDDINVPVQWVDINGNMAFNPKKGHIYIVKRGSKASKILY